MVGFMNADDTRANPAMLTMRMPRTAKPRSTSMAAMRSVPVVGDAAGLMTVSVLACGRRGTYHIILQGRSQLGAGGAFTRMRRGVREMKQLRHALLAALATLAGCEGNAQPVPGLTAFTNVNVLPMASETVLANQTVVVADGVIVAAGPAAAVEVPRGAMVIDGSGRYLMPGLAEMHAHVPPGDNPPREDIEDILFLYVANGITTIRGMLGSAYQIPLADEIERGEALGPNFYVGAPSINGGSAPTPADAERLVREHVEAGYDLQKIHPGVSLDTWDHMVAVAQELGLTYSGHVPADVGLVHAIETGMSTVDHLDGYIQAIASDDVQAQVSVGPISLGGLARGVDEEKLEEIVHMTIEHDVYVVPTM